MFGKHLQLNEQTLDIIEKIGRHMPRGFFIYEARPPFTLIYANQACFDIFGCGDLEQFRALTGWTFRGIVHPEDFDAVQLSIEQQIQTGEDAMDYVEYRVICRDGAVRWVNDYGHYTETEAYGGIYYVFISDITEKKAERDQDFALRGAVIETLTNAYNTVWLITDVETERCALFHTDNDAVHARAYVTP